MAMMLGLTSRMATFRVQRDIKNYSNQPLTVILPGVALAELWQMMGLLKNTLRLISGLILIAVQLGLSAMMLASIRAREHEIHLLRVIGAPPWFLLVKWERDWEHVLYCSERCRRNKGACLALIISLSISQAIPDNRYL